MTQLMFCFCIVSAHSFFSAKFGESKCLLQRFNSIYGIYGVLENYSFFEEKEEV